MAMRKKHSVEFKVKVALEAIRQLKTINELTTEYGVHATQITTWKKQALAALPTAFSGKQGRVDDHQQAEIDELHRQIGQLIAERDWLKKKSSVLPSRPGKP
jgi:transposase